MELAVRCAGVEKSYRRGFLGKTRVLSGIELELPRGAALALVGPNGSGKSTLLRLIAGLERPGAGALAVFGGDPDEAAVRARIGYLAEESALPRELRARDALDLAAALAGLDRRTRRACVPEWLARVGLESRSGETLATFSRGMLQRFGLAQAFVHGPELVLLDEPTAGLDALGHQVLDRLLSDARERGATLIFASHMIADLLSHAGEVAVLLDGAWIAPRPAREFLSDAARVLLEIEGLDAGDLDRLELEVERAGGRVRSRSPAPAALASFYRSLRGAGDGRLRAPEAR
jgi:ABC-2 type transport system ATP-binding protein